jgi:ATP-dependent RNA helicase UAP56/SUB2
MRANVQEIFMNCKNANKQVMMFSATMDKETKETCSLYMKQPFELFIDSDSKLTLHGLKQYYVKLDEK